MTPAVSVMLRSLEERAGLLGRVVIGLVGMAWAAVTFLVLATSTRSRATRAEDRAQRAESELEAIRQGLQGRR